MVQAKVHEGSLGGSGPTGGRICETGRFEAASERERELWSLKVVLT